MLRKHLQHGAAAGAGAAVAGVVGFGVFIVLLVAGEAVIVGELFARQNVAHGFDVDATRVDHRLAIGLAGMIDEASLIAFYPGIDRRAFVDAEQQDSRVMVAVIFVTGVRLFGRDALANVFDDARSLADGLGGEDAAALYRGGTNFEG